MLDLKLVAATDPEVASAMEQELGRQRDHIELIASENFVSPAVMAAMGSHLTNKYAEGYPGKRYYGGCQYVDVVEDLARQRACELFGAEHANVQPHSGAQANLAVYFGLLEPGDTILGMNLSHGGHLTHGSPVNMSGKYFNIVPYGVSEQDERIDYDEVRRLALEHKPKLLLAGASAYPRIIDFERLGAIAKEAGCLFMVDMAHIAGLVAAGLHPSPVPYADVVTTTTHKTLRGPRGGLILCRKQYAKKIDSAIFPGTQGGPLMHVIAGKAVCLKEAMTPEFKAYQQQIPVLVVGGEAGSFLGEYQAGGYIVVLGLNTQGRAPVGRFCAAGMHGGKIFLRTEADMPFDLPSQVIAREADENDMAEIAPYVRRFAQAFGKDAEGLLADRYMVLAPNTHNPYKTMYATN